jgi:hypothetical protein
MTIYYVDFNQGSDSNNGTTPTTPWKRPPQFEGIGPNVTILATDTVYLKGTYVAEGTGVNMWLINNGRYTHGCKLLPWPGEPAYTINANDAWDIVVSIGRRVTIKSCIATGARENSVAAGFRFAPGAEQSLVEDCVAKNNKRYGFYGNNVSANAQITFKNCLATENTPAITSGRFGAGFHLDATGACLLDSCISTYNGKTALVGTDLDGRGFSLQTASFCVLQNCLSVGNGDLEGKYGRPNGSGLEGFASTNVKILHCRFLDEATGGEIKSGCDYWDIVGNVFEGKSTGVLQWGKYLTTGSTTSNIINNTIISTSIQPFSVCLSLSSGNCVVKNNIFIKTNRGDWPAVEISDSVVDIDPTTIVFDYNLDYGNTSNLHIKLVNTTVNTTYSKATWQGLYPAHSVNSIETNPKLKEKYTIPNDSPAKHAGVFISPSKSISLGMFNNPPSIGAWEYLDSRDTRI